MAAVDKDYPGLSLERRRPLRGVGRRREGHRAVQGRAREGSGRPRSAAARRAARTWPSGRPDDALPMLRKVLEKRPSSAEAHHYIGRALMLKRSRRPGRSAPVPEAGRRPRPQPRRVSRLPRLGGQRRAARAARAGARRDRQGAGARQAERRGLLAEGRARAHGGRRRRRHPGREARAGAATLALRGLRHAGRVLRGQERRRAALLRSGPSAIAGDGRRPQPDGTCPHPFWRYRFGKLLRRARQDRRGARRCSSPRRRPRRRWDQRPGWLGPLEFLTAEVLRKAGARADAVEHYRRFLEVAPGELARSAPTPAAALAQLTRTCTEHRRARPPSARTPRRPASRRAPSSATPARERRSLGSTAGGAPRRDHALRSVLRRAWKAPRTRARNGLGLARARRTQRRPARRRRCVHRRAAGGTRPGARAERRARSNAARTKTVRAPQSFVPGLAREAAPPPRPAP